MSVPDLKTCPFCKEEVKKGASICPHCRKDISASGMINRLGCSLCVIGFLIFFVVLIIIGLLKGC